MIAVVLYTCFLSPLSAMLPGVTRDISTNDFMDQNLTKIQLGKKLVETCHLLDILCMELGFLDVTLPACVVFPSRYVWKHGTFLQEMQPLKLLLSKSNKYS